MKTRISNRTPLQSPRSGGSLLASLGALVGVVAIATTLRPLLCCLLDAVTGFFCSLTDYSLLYEQLGGPVLYI